MLYYSAAFMHPTQTVCNILDGFDSLPTDGKVYTLITGGGYLLAMKHWDLGNYDHSLSHRIIALIECCPLLGGLFAIIETLATQMIWACTKNNPSSFIKDSQNYFTQLKGILSQDDQYQDSSNIFSAHILSKDQQLANFAQTLLLNHPGDPRANYVANLIDDGDLR